MGKQHLKYIVTFPVGFGVLVLWLLLAIVLSWDLSQWFYYIFVGGVILPMVFLGAYLDRKFKVPGGMAKAAKAAMAPEISEGYVPCPNCRQPVKKGLEFCSYCGTKMIADSFIPCPNCKQGLKPGVLFCTACGTKINP